MQRRGVIFKRSTLYYYVPESAVFYDAYKDITWPGHMVLYPSYSYNTRRRRCTDITTKNTIAVLSGSEDGLRAFRGCAGALSVVY